MKLNISRLAVLALLSVSAIFSGCNPEAAPVFNPDGLWDFTLDRFEAFSTYTETSLNMATSFDIEATVPPGTDLTVATAVPVTFNSVTREVTFVTATGIVDASNEAELAYMETVVPIGGYACTGVTYERVSVKFLGDEGHTAELRVEEGYQLQDTAVSMNCTDLLLMAKTNIEATMVVPTEISTAVFLGGLRIETLEFARTWGVAQVISGERTSASEDRSAGGEVVTYNFHLQTEALRALRDRMGAAIFSRVAR